MHTARVILTTTIATALLVAAFFIVARVRAEEDAPRTQTKYTSTGEGVEVIPYLVWDREKLYVDFENYDNVTEFHFNLTYDSDNNTRKHGVEGTISPASWPVQGYYNGEPYLRHELTIGTCSGLTCRYHKSLSNMKLTVTSTLASGDVKEVTRIVTIPLD